MTSRNARETSAATPKSAPPVHVPQPPPEPILGVPGPTYAAHDGHVWRRAMRSWELVDAFTAPKLLAGFRDDSRDAGDWFHARAAELADELEAAIAEAYPMERAA